MSSIQVNQEFMVETDITVTVNNTRKDIMGKQARMLFLSQITNNKKSMTLVDTENNSVGEDYFPPLERF